MTVDLSTHASPTRHVMRHVPNAMRAVAPERTAELRDLWKRLGLNLTMLADEHWVCHHDERTHEIRISLGTMTVLWCFSHAYVVLHDRVFKEWLGDEKKQIDLTSDPVVSAAMRLLGWALANWTSKADRCEQGWTTRWPEGCPAPVAEPVHGSYENVADELALVAVAFLVHHEIAHARLQHTRRVDDIETLQEEQDADATAVAWLLKGLEHDSSFFVKRALGIATALSAATALGIHSRYYDGDTHPRHFDRLIHALDPYIPVKDHKVWQFIIVALKLHMDHVGIKVLKPEFESGRDCFEAYLDHLAEDDANERRKREESGRS